MPYLGHWTGDFVASENTTGFPTEKVTLKGYIQVYKTNRMVKMNLENAAQTVILNGNWKVEKDGDLVVHIAGVNIQQPAKDVMEAAGTPFLPDSAIQSGFKPDLIFKLNKDHSQLLGLEMTIGPLTGHFDLNKDGPPR